jgi:hypothetical protein
LSPLLDNRNVFVVLLGHKPDADEVGDFDAWATVLGLFARRVCHSPPRVAGGLWAEVLVRAAATATVRLLDWEFCFVFWFVSFLFLIRSRHEGSWF